MALPPSLQSSTTPQELELIATEDMIEIIPLFSMDRIRLLSGIYGPFKPPAKARIPLWMAIDLKQRMKCHIVAPEWLSVEFLQDRLNEETTKGPFSVLPFRFAEVAKVLLDHASDDFESPEKIRVLLKDIREARQAKSRDGLKMIDHVHMRILNICSMEINEIRPFFIKSMGILTKLAPPPPEADETAFESYASGNQSFSGVDSSFMETDW